MRIVEYKNITKRLSRLRYRTAAQLGRQIIMGNIKMTQYTKVAIKVIENIKKNPTLRPDEEWERIIKLDIKRIEG